MLEGSKTITNVPLQVFKVKLFVKITWVVVTLLSLLLYGFPKMAAAPIVSAQEFQGLQIQEIDPRYQQLNKFFDKYRCPEPRYVTEYIETADKYGIDYRLLPAISLKESTCQKQMPGLTIKGKYVNGACFNAWGWLIYGNNRKCFDSIPAGIEEVLKNFATNPKWQGTVDQILYRYNGTVESKYPARVKNIMSTIE